VCLPTQSGQLSRGELRQIPHFLDNHFPIVQSAVGTTECMLIYYFITEELAASDSEQECNLAPYWAQYCVDIAIVLVSMSDRNTANKLYALSI
jgi:hypothetical protein